MSDLGPCDTCGTLYEECPVSDPDVQWTTDANGNHDGLCCEDCEHHADYGAMVNAPLSEATIAALRDHLAAGDYPCGVWLRSRLWRRTPHGRCT